MFDDTDIQHGAGADGCATSGWVVGGLGGLGGWCSVVFTGVVGGGGKGCFFSIAGWVLEVGMGGGEDGSGSGSGVLSMLVGLVLGKGGGEGNG